MKSVFIFLMSFLFLTSAVATSKSDRILRSLTSTKSPNATEVSKSVSKYFAKVDTKAEPKFIGKWSGLNRD